MKFSVPCYVTGGADRGASDWSAEESRAAVAAKAVLERAVVTFDQALLGAIAESEGFLMDDDEAAYFGQNLDDLKLWAGAYRAAEQAANEAAALPQHCISAGICVALGEP